MIDADCPNPFASDGRLHDFIVYRFAHPAALASLVDGVVAGRNCIAIGGMGSGRRALLLAFDQDASLQIPHRCVWATPDGIPAPSGEVRDARRLEELFERLAERGFSSGEVVIADAGYDAWRELPPDTVSHLVSLAAARRWSSALKPIPTPRDRSASVSPGRRFVRLRGMSFASTGNRSLALKPSRGYAR